MDMIRCLYKNILCPYFNIDNSKPSVIKNENGPLIGYGFNLSNISSVELYKEGIPLYLINKLHPLLSNVINMSETKEALKAYNLYLTTEETDMINMHYLSKIFKDLEENHKNFKELNENLKLSIFLRVLEQRLSPEKINSYINNLLSNNIDKYINSLIHSERSHMTTGETLDFQMMITQTKNILQPKKCLLSLIIGKSLLWSEEFLDLVNKLNNYKISITYYDSENYKTELFIDFTEDLDEIKDKILEIRKDNQEKTEIVDINSILEEQKELFRYYDEGVKKCIVIISTREDDIYYKYEFTKPDNKLLEELHNSGITIFDYSDHINFIVEDTNEDDYGFFNSTRNEYIQFVPFLNFSDMNKNILTLTNIINRYPIPIKKLEDIYLDMEHDEEIVFEFDLNNIIKHLMDKGYEKYNRLKLSFDTSDLNIYFSKRFIFPNNYSNDYNASINNNKIYYDLKDLEEKNINKIFMTVQSFKRTENAVIKLDLCDKEESCLKKNFYLKFDIAFIVIGIALILYGIYICFYDNSYKKEGNIFEMK